ncbi:transglutaminase-like domain-containing protein [Clostridium culturomicium]|uniref:transglutaminase-like domain-containing protein n=1 Tax=Clostridium culturomicium TaxID=1499683 RepID=UPI00385749F8
MRLKSEKTLSLFLVIINLIVIVKLLKDSFIIQNFDYGFIAFLIICGILIYLLLSEVLKGKRRKLIFIAAILLISGVLAYKYFNVLVDEILYLKQNILSINNAALERSPIDFQVFKHLFAIVIPVLVVTGAVITKRWSKYPIALTSIIFIGFWYLIFYKKVESNLPYFIGVFVASIGVSEHIKRCKEYEGKELKINISKRVVIVTILILSISLPFIVKVLPQEFNGKSINGIFKSMKNQFAEQELTEADYISNAVRYRFSMRESGYSDSNYSLGGPIRISKREVFTVKADKPYYLRARVKDTYSGNSWTAPRENIREQLENTSKYGGGLNYLYEALEGYEGYTDLKAEEKEIVITPERNFKSGSCFTPNGAFKIEEVKDKVFYNDIPTFMSDNYIREPYVVKFVSYGNYDNYLEGIENENYFKYVYKEDYTLPMRTYGQTDLDYYGYLDSLVNTTDPDELKKYNKFKWSYINYMQVPETVGEEVYLLVESILNEAAKVKGSSGIEALSNQEKALAIRNYLKENYKYKTDVKAVDPNIDFVTQFLNVDKEGYCTYFASANTIMCRIAGIPARYAEGYNMSDKKNSKDEYVVTNEEAHAWTEVLVNPNRDIWGITDAVADANEEVTDVEEQVQIEENIPNKPEVSKPDMGVEKAEPVKSDFSLGLKIVLVFVGIIIFSIAVIGIIMGIFTLRRKRIISSSSIVPLYNYCLRRLGTIGIVKKDNQGDLEFSKSIGDEELRELMMKLAQGVYEEFYGGFSNNSIDKGEYFDYIENYIKGINKGHKYIVKKYCSFTINGGY